MIKKKNLHTSFIKFLIEKYADETQKLPQRETQSEEEEPKKEDDIDLTEEPKEPNSEEEEEVVDEMEKLLNEYKRLERRYGNNWIHNRGTRKTL